MLTSNSLHKALLKFWEDVISKLDNKTYVNTIFKVRIYNQIKSISDLQRYTKKDFK
jgi:hypothetical protein